MKTRIKISFLLAFVASVFLMSCDNDKFDFASSDSENAQNEAVSESYADDADDISSVALSSDDATLNGKVSSTGRRVFKVTDPAKRLDCAEVSIELAADNSTTVRKVLLQLTLEQAAQMPKAIFVKGLYGLSTVVAGSYLHLQLKPPLMAIL